MLWPVWGDIEKMLQVSSLLLVHGTFDLESIGLKFFSKIDWWDFQFWNANYFYQKVGEYNKQVAANFPGETGEMMQLPYVNNTLAFTITYNSEQYAKFDDAVAAFVPQFLAIEQVHISYYTMEVSYFNF